mmetsp:Transcript_34540/g.97876  ORF Transcript_34540/g.97876 Transcript_34540/m.97876 type:complete len:621 (+) Transcript_34540:203-2065(+)
MAGGSLPHVGQRSSHDDRPFRWARGSSPGRAVTAERSNRVADFTARRTQSVPSGEDLARASTAATSYSTSKASRSYLERRLAERGDLVVPYRVEEFDLCTSKRGAAKRGSRLKLPPLPHESLNSNSPRVRSILEKLDHYRSTPGKLEELDESLGLKTSPRRHSLRASANDIGRPFPDSSYEHIEDVVQLNIEEVSRIPHDFRAKRSAAFMQEVRKKTELAADRRARMREEVLVRKAALQHRHEEMKAERERQEQISRLREAGEKISVSVHLVAMIGCVGQYGKELRRERETLRERTTAALIIQRAAKPWVADKRSQREAWALEVIAPVFTRYVKARRDAMKQQAAKKIYTFVMHISSTPNIISTIHFFRLCCVRLQRFLKRKHQEITAQRSVDIGMWLRWEKVMMDHLTGAQANQQGDVKRSKSKAGKGKKKKHQANSSVGRQGYSFADLGGFGAVDESMMRHVPRKLKAQLLTMFRRFRKMAAWRALEQYHKELQEWEKAWDEADQIERARQQVAGINPETEGEREARKSKAIPPPKQLRKLLTNHEISTLHSIGIHILNRVALSAEEVDEIEARGISMADLPESLREQVTEDIENLAMSLITYDTIGDAISAAVGGRM